MTTLYQRRHYENVARSLREAKALFKKAVRTEDTQYAWEVIVLLLAEQFAVDNPLFDAGRFYKAVGYSK